MSLDLSDYLKCVMKSLPNAPADEPKWRQVLKILLSEYIKADGCVTGLFRHHKETAVNLLNRLHHDPDSIDPTNINAHLPAETINPKGSFAKLLYVFSLLYPEYSIGGTKKLHHSLRKLKALDDRISKILLETRESGAFVYSCDIKAIRNLARYLSPNELAIVIPSLLVKIGGDEDTVVRFEAVRAIGMLGDYLGPQELTIALDTLVVQLSNPRCNRKDIVIESIGKLVPYLTNEQNFHALLQLMQVNNGSLYIQVALARTIAIMTDYLTQEQRTAVLQQVRRKLTSQNIQEKMQALQICSKLGKKHLSDQDLGITMEAFLTMLRDAQNFNMLLNAARCIENLGAFLTHDALLETVLPVLVTQLNNPNTYWLQIPKIAWVMGSLSMYLTASERGRFVPAPAFLAQFHQAANPNISASWMSESLSYLKDYLPLETLNLLARNFFILISNTRHHLTWDDFRIIARLNRYLTAEQQAGVLQILLKLLHEQSMPAVLDIGRIIAELVKHLAPDMRLKIVKGLIRNFDHSRYNCSIGSRQTSANALSLIAEQNKAMAFYLLIKLREKIPSNSDLIGFEYWAESVRKIETSIEAGDRKQLASHAIERHLGEDVTSIVGAYLGYRR